MSNASHSAMRVEVAIVGGGPAGLSAALILGRCLRHVVVIDSGEYRNADAVRLRGFLTRDHGCTPDDLRALGRKDIEQYVTVRVRRDTVVDARREGEGFSVLTKSGEQIDCKVLLLATGFRDTLPTFAGAKELHGKLVVPCPYCDAWEVRGQPLAVYSHPDESGAEYARIIAQWSRDIVFCAERRPQLSDETRAELTALGVRIENRELRSVERDGEGARLVFSEGPTVWRRMVFYHLGGGAASNLAQKLGAKADERGSVIVSRGQESSVPGLFVAGDATRDVLQAVVAAGEGASAAVAINSKLCKERK
jgi:thioredoxin reductase